MRKTDVPELSAVYVIFPLKYIQQMFTFRQYNVGKTAVRRCRRHHIKTIIHAAVYEERFSI